MVVEQCAGVRSGNRFFLCFVFLASTFGSQKCNRKKFRTARFIFFSFALLLTKMKSKQFCGRSIIVCTTITIISDHMYVRCVVHGSQQRRMIVTLNSFHHFIFIFFAISSFVQFSFLNLFFCFFFFFVYLFSLLLLQSTDFGVIVAMLDICFNVHMPHIHIFHKHAEILFGIFFFAANCDAEIVRLLRQRCAAIDKRVHSQPIKPHRHTRDIHKCLLAS